MADYGRDGDLGFPTPGLGAVQDTENAIESSVEQLEQAIWQGVIEVADEKRLAAAENYAAEDVLSESISTGTPFVFRNVVDEAGGSGEIVKAQLFIAITALTPRITLYLSSTLPTCNMNDNAANTGPRVNEWPGWQGQIDFLACEDLGGGSTSVVTPGTYGNLALPFKCAGKDLYGWVVTRDAITDEIAGMLMGIKLQIRKD
ncbi:MAG: hypothetical protein M0R06_00195 [Sphaerochaeta sp.]|jgi:hypothetical protein|nr:hypothetical protein [Sphaerochaeta sp.]